MKLENGKKKLNKENLKYRTKNYTNDFQQYQTIRSFGESIYNGKINIDEGEMDQR